MFESWKICTTTPLSLIYEFHKNKRIKCNLQMNKQLIKEIQDCLNNKISENSCLDYKQYIKKDYLQFDLIRDVISFLNCKNEKDLKHNKFIIFGVVDQSLGIKGIDRSEWFDDKIFQDKIKSFVDGNPNVESGFFEYNNKNIGYIAILKNNFEIPYLLKKDITYKNKTFEKGIGWYREKTSSLLMDIKIFDHFYSWIYKYRKINNQTIQLIAQNNEQLISDKARTHTNSKKGKIKIFTEINDGIYGIYYFNKLWLIKFQTTSINLIRIYNKHYINKTNVIKVGKLINNAPMYTTLDPLANAKDIDLFNFSSNSIELRADGTTSLFATKL